MLLFKPYHVKLILSGRKTQTRRKWIDKQTGMLRENPLVKVGAIHKFKTEMLSTKYFAKGRILKVYREKLGDISEEDAYREGYDSKYDFLMKYKEINKIKNQHWKEELQLPTWVIVFERVDHLYKTLETKEQDLGRWFK